MRFLDFCLVRCLTPALKLSIEGAVVVPADPPYMLQSVGLIVLFCCLVCLNIGPATLMSRTGNLYSGFD